MSLPTEVRDELCALRIPIAPLLLRDSGESASSATSSPPVLVWHFVKQLLAKQTGGSVSRPVERVVRGVIGEDELRDNERALDDLLTLAGIFVEAASTGKRPVSARPRSSSQSLFHGIRAPRPPFSSAATTVVAVEHVVIRDEREALVVAADDNNAVPRNATEAAVARLAQHINVDQIHLVVPQLRMLLKREHAALLADIDDVRRLIALGSTSFSSSPSSALQSVANSSPVPSLAAMMMMSSRTTPNSVVPSSRTTPTLLMTTGSSSPAVAHGGAAGSSSSPGGGGVDGATSRVRSVLLARMNRHAEFEDDTVERKQAVVVFDDDGPEDLRDL